MSDRETMKDVSHTPRTVDVNQIWSRGGEYTEDRDPDSPTSEEDATPESED